MREMALGSQISVGDGALLGEWIVDGLNGQIGSVGSVVPPQYPAYCRILHPAKSETGEALTWKRVAELTGGITHPLVQWEALVGRASGSLGLEIDPPLRGRLDSTIFTKLCDLLMAYEAARAGHWRFAFWIGWAWSSALRPPDGKTEALRASTVSLGSSSITGDELRRPVLNLPASREYRVMVVPKLSGALFDRPDGPWGELSTPNLMWPRDRRWCLGTEIDFDSTIVGGSESLVGDLLASPDLETWKIGPNDCLTSDADRINHS
jgi:hypothetical protein